MAASKKAGKKATKRAGARGLPLVQLAIAADRRNRKPKRPLVADAIAKLAMPDGARLPASLAAWLAHDGATLDVVRDGRLNWRSFVELCVEEFGPETASICETFAKVLTGSCLVLPGGSDQRTFLYAGVPDERARRVSGAPDRHR